MGIQDIKNNITMEHYLSTRGYKVTKRSATGYELSSCPMCGHTNTKGNVKVFDNKDNEVLNCFHCGESADIIKVVEKVEGVDSRQAIKILKDMVGGVSTGRIQRKKRPSKSSEPVAYDYSNLVEYAHERLLESEEGMEYFRKRGIHEDAIIQLKLGYLEHGFNDFDKFNLYDAKSCYGEMGEPFKYVVPMIVGDKIPSLILKSESEGARNTKGAMQIFNANCLNNSDRVFICEGWADATSIIDVGYDAISINGVTNLPKLKDLLSQYKDTTYIIAFDNDNTGLKHCNELAKWFDDNKYTYSILRVPKEVGKDCNDWIRADRSWFIEGITEGYEKIDNDFINSRSFAKDIDELFNLAKAGATGNYVSTGYTYIDNMLGGGLYEGLNILASVPNIGKTSFAYTIAEKMAIDCTPVMMFSMELQKKDLFIKSISRMNRLIGTNTLDLNGVKKGNWKDIDEKTIASNVRKLKSYSNNIFLYDAQMTMKVENIIAEVDKFIKITKRLPVVIVDYLQLVDTDQFYKDDKAKIDKVTIALRNLAIKHHIPLLAISSINRESYKTKAEINLASMKGSGDIEYSADCIITMSKIEQDDDKFNEIFYNDENAIAKAKAELNKNNGYLLNIQMPKSRNSTIDTTGKPVVFEPSYSYFESGDTYFKMGLKGCIDVNNAFIEVEQDSYGDVF